MRKLLAVACTGCALVIAGAALSAAAPAPSFRSTFDAYTGTYCDALALGDLNGDGQTDVSVGCAGGEETGLLVFFNRGDGRFTPAGEYLTEGSKDQVSSVATSDLDGDGAVDLVASSSVLAVLLNRGDGTFLPPVGYRKRGGDHSVAIADLDGDEHADLITDSYGRNAVSVRLNRGDGTFPDPADYKTGRHPRDVAVGDLNGDGRADLVTANEGAHTVSVLLNRGDGTFRAKHDYRAGRINWSVAIKDLDGDGSLDLVTSNGQEKTVSVLLNRGGGTFQDKQDHRVGNAWSSAIGDLNGDGKSDVATAKERGISVLLNKGGGRFQQRLDYSSRRANGTNTGVSIADLNGDRRLDLVFTNTTVLRSDARSEFSVLINTPGLCNMQYVKGKTLAAARRTLALVNCRVGRIRRVYSKTAKRGRVISQKPRFGAVLPAGGKVDLVVSRGMPS